MANDPDWFDQYAAAVLDDPQFVGKDTSTIPVTPAKEGKDGVFYLDVRYTFPSQIVAYSKEQHAAIEKKFVQLLKTAGADRWMAQHESNKPTTGINTHIQAFVHLKVKLRPSTFLNLLKEEFKQGLYHVAPASDAGKLKLHDYAMKHDSRVYGPYADHFVYLGQDLPNLSALYPWQLDILKEFTDGFSTEDRNINWLHDQKGKQGKSKIAKFMELHHKVPVIQFANSRDMMESISGFRYQPVYIFDLTRTKPAEVKIEDLYSVMEQLKNGSLQKTKYKVEKWLQMPAKVWVFSNFLPQKSALTSDRWKLWNIDANKHLSPVHG